jgi:hypothetical protein
MYFLTNLITIPQYGYRFYCFITNNPNPCIVLRGSWLTRTKIGQMTPSVGWARCSLSLTVGQGRVATPLTLVLVSLASLWSSTATATDHLYWKMGISCANATLRKRRSTMVHYPFSSYASHSHSSMTRSVHVFHGVPAPFPKLDPIFVTQLGTGQQLSTLQRSMTWKLLEQETKSLANRAETDLTND